MIHFLGDKHALPALHVFTIQYLSAPPLPLQTLPFRYAYATYIRQNSSDFSTVKVLRYTVAITRPRPIMPA